MDAFYSARKKKLKKMNALKKIFHNFSVYNNKQ